MKFNKILASLACALLLVGTACTDEVKYSETAEPAGDQVFFPSTTVTTLDITNTTTELTVPVERYIADNEVSVPLTCTAKDMNGNTLEFFTFPEKVTFAKDAKTANINIGVDFSKVVAEEDYYLTITLDGEQVSPYGISTIELTAIYAPWSDWKRYGSKGEYGTGTLSAFSVVRDELSVYYSESLEGAKRTKYQFGDYGCPELEKDENDWNYLVNGINATIIVYEEEVYTNSSTGKQYYRCSFPQIEVPNGDTGTYVDFVDTYTYLKNINPGAANNDQAVIESWKGGCLYDPETGVFDLSLIAFGSALGEGKFQQCEETFTLPGFKNYYINFNHVGNIVDPTGQETVVIQALKSDDIFSYAYKVAPGTLNSTDIQNTVAEIMAEEEPTLIKDTEYYITYTPEEEGDYTLVAVAYDEAGNKIYDTYFNFAFTTVQAESEWAMLGEAAYTDGFIYSAFNGLGGTTWMVNVERNKKNPGLIRMVNPYNSKYWPEGYEGWDLPGNYYITLSIEDPEAVYLDYSPLGIQLSPNDGDIIGYSEAADLILSLINDEGLEYEEALEYVKDEGVAGTYKDGIITFPPRTLMIGFVGLGKFYYANLEDEATGEGLFCLDLNDVDLSTTKLAPRMNTPKGDIKAKKLTPADLKFRYNPARKSAKMTQKDIKKKLTGNGNLIISNVKKVIK